MLGTSLRPLAGGSDPVWKPVGGAETVNHNALNFQKRWPSVTTQTKHAAVWIVAIVVIAAIVVLLILFGGGGGSGGGGY
jgi:hypothetical protein